MRESVLLKADKTRQNAAQEASLCGVNPAHQGLHCHTTLTTTATLTDDVLSTAP